MARRKGKSNRRIKDWYQRYVSGDEGGGTTAHRQKVSQRAVKLPAERLLDADEPGDVDIEEILRIEAMVIGLFPGGAAVRVGQEELLCGIAKTFRAPEEASALAVGDDVTVALTQSQHADASESDKDRADGMILSRQPRRTALAKPSLFGRRRKDDYSNETFDKVIVSNMDVLLIIAATQSPPLGHGLIDRFLIIAERGELEPILVINKIDLGWGPKGKDVLREFRALGVATFRCSAVSGKGVRKLRKALRGRRSVLAGASGVGKSTLVNRLIPGADAITRSVRERDRHGRHTTAAAGVYDLPCGGLIVDTPGIRELGMKIEADELPWYFPEFEQFASNCRFNDCSHTHEPDCSVQAAVKSGKILPRRYNSYLRLREML